MPSIAQCKKLIAQQEREYHKPTISHYRDMENGIKKGDKIKLNSKHPFGRGNNKDKIYTVTGFSFHTVGKLKGKKRIELDNYTFAMPSQIKKNPTTRKTANPTASAYKTRIAKIKSGTTLKSELQRIATELATLEREAKGKHANKDYYKPRIAQLKSALAQGLKAVKNPTTGAVKNPRGSQWRLVYQDFDNKVYLWEIEKGNKNKPVAVYKVTQSAIKPPTSIDGAFLRHSSALESAYKNKRNGTTKRRANFTNADYKNYQKIAINDLAAMFQGAVNNQSLRVLEPDTAPPNKFRLGFLAQAKVKRNGLTIPIDFDGESLLSADTRRNLWIVGKDSRIDAASLKQLGIKKPVGNGLEYIGDLFQIDYVTAKKHIENGETVRFFHKLGEADKIRPRLYIDKDGFPIIHGGNYDIWNVGIVN
jgi:hypothetical protein